MLQYLLNITSNRDWESNLSLPLGKVLVSTTQQVFLFAVIGVGIVCNCVLLVVILASRQLRYPRHIIWVTIAIANLFYLIQRIMEILTMIDKNSLICQFFVLNIGIAYSLVLLCLFLAALDRYAAIAYPEWYKKKVTNRFVLKVVCVAQVLSCIGITSHFWLGYTKVTECSINVTQMHWVFVWNLFLGIWAVILHIKIFIKSRALIRQYPGRLNSTPLTIHFQANHHSSRTRYQIGEYGKSVREILTLQPTRLLDQQNVEIETAQPNSENIQTSSHSDCFRWLPALRPQVSRLEIRAALNMSINTIPFWFFSFPVVCNTIAIYWCARLQMDCTINVVIHPYLRKTFFFHPIYNPLMYMLCCTEFRRALVRLIKKFSTF